MQQVAAVRDVACDEWSRTEPATSCGSEVERCEEFAVLPVTVAGFEDPIDSTRALPRPSNRVLTLDGPETFQSDNHARKLDFVDGVTEQFHSAERRGR